ncbi:MAG: MerR family transcriptional regulator [Proteobacteria bacterium]|nr:MerR family transcriptional regulator [Pseudomonadota bacterium]
MTEPIYRIGEAARASGVSVRTIRFYEEVGLVPKAQRRNGAARTGGERLYREADVARLRFIHRARALDLGLDDIRMLLTIVERGECPGGSENYRVVIGRHLAEIDQRLARLAALRDQIEGLLARGNDSSGQACVEAGCECLGAAVEPGPLARQGTVTRVKNGGEHV